MARTERAPMSVVVTGAAGFLGKEIVVQLLDAGHEVFGLVRRPAPELEALGCRLRFADLTDAEATATALEGAQAVYHVAAKAGIWGSYEDYYAANVTGTQNVIHGCLKAGCGKLIYTSSPSVTFGGEPHPGVDESVPYPQRHLNHYCRTKAEAEGMVLQADQHEGLLTVALRPHIIWGPGDPHILPRLVEAARAGRLLRVGPGENLVDITYVSNAARAHLLAEQQLVADSEVHGRAFFISQGRPVNLWDWVNEILTRLELKPVERAVPLPVAQVLGAVLETIYRWFRLSGEPRMTRFLAAQLGTSHYYDISAARRLLGYEPEISIEQGMDRLIDDLKERIR